MSNSTHRVEVVEIPAFERHPDADSLSLVRIWGYTCVVRTADWTPGQLAAYIPPDSICPDTPQFAFLKDSRRIRARRFRGVMSMGLLMPAPAGSALGDDVAEAMGITHYDPPALGGASGMEIGPAGFRPTYDVDTWYRFRSVLSPGEPVVVTEKIHGANARFTFAEGRMWCGARSNWRLQDPRSEWWQALGQHPWIEEFCRAHPGYTLYGELFGRVQDLNYGARPGQYFVNIFDILDDKGQWVDYADAPALGPNLQWVPLLYAGPYDEAKFTSLIDGRSAHADHVREGVVIKPVRERTSLEIGRVILKAVSGDYLARK